METIHDGFHEQDIGLLASEDHFVTLSSGHGKWLLAQNMFPSCRRTKRPSMVQVVRQGNVDDIYIGVIKKGLIVMVSTLDAKCAGSLLCTFSTAAGDC